MNDVAIAFLVVNSIGVLVLPRKWAPLPLLVCCCYMTTGHGIAIGLLNFPFFRLILALGAVRALIRRESLFGGLNTIDKLVIALAGWTMIASLFHEWAPGSGPIYIGGVVFNVVLVYFLCRSWCAGLADLTALMAIVAWLLAPVAVAMVAEHVVGKNIFSIFGGIPEIVTIRDGKIRAQGPFQHPILAGIVGSVCVPLMMGIWRRHRISSLLGLMACITMVLASTSSTPMMSLVFGIGGVMMWRFRSWVRLVRWAAIGAYLCAGLLMTRPAYFLMSKFDLTGSSTGWYRSRLIQSAFEHLSEWWAFGTDDTGAWMYPNLDPKRSDITNYYLYFGIHGGLLTVLLLIAIIWCAFVWVGKGVADTSPVPQIDRFMIWCLGSGLLAHTVSSLAVAYFDQSLIFFWLNVAAISTAFSVAIAGAATKGPRRTFAKHPMPGRRATARLLPRS